jgi:hypothetical protein
MTEIVEDVEVFAYLQSEKGEALPPACLCPIVGAFLRSWSASLAADSCSLLAPLIARSAGSKSTRGIERVRAYMAADWLIRVHIPAWLHLSPSLRPAAKQVRVLSPVVDATALQAAFGVLKVANERAKKLGMAAWENDYEAARDAYFAAMGDAGGFAALAGMQIRGMGPIHSLAWSAVTGASWAAAGKMLAPTVAALQSSALRLLQRMIDTRD